MHRRPSWAQKESTYQTYIKKQAAGNRATADYGMDNFSYDDTHIPKWQASQQILRHLLPELRDAVETFTLAGAAVCTALERVEKLDEEAVDRMNPAISHGHLVNLRISDQTQARVGAETPPTSSPTSSMPSMDAPVKVSNQTPLIQFFPQLPVNMAGLESPPFTPVDSKVANTPVSEPLVGPNGTAPDLDSVTAQLSPFSSRNSLTTLSSPGFKVSNEIAWKHFVGEFNEALRDLRENALPGLKGAVHEIERICTEIGWDRTLRMEQKVALDNFGQWWKTMKPKVSTYEEKVQELRRHHVATQKQFEAMENKVCNLPL